MIDKIEKKVHSHISNDKLSTINILIADCYRDAEKYWKEIWTWLSPTIKCFIEQTSRLPRHQELACDADNIENIFKIMVIIFRVFVDYFTFKRLALRKVVL